MFFETIKYYQYNNEKFLFVRRVLYFPPYTIEKEKLFFEKFSDFNKISQSMSRVFKRCVNKNITKAISNEEAFLSFNAMLNGCLDQMILFKIEFSAHSLRTIFEVLWTGLEYKK